MNHPHLAEGQDVNFVSADNKTNKGKITQVISEHVARIEYGAGNAAVAPFSDKKEPNTFHFDAASAQSGTNR